MPEQPKKPYAAPELKEWGSLLEITQANLYGTTSDSGTFPTLSNPV